MFRTSFGVEIQYVNSSDHQHNLLTLPRLSDFRKCDQLINFLKKNSKSLA